MSKVLVTGGAGFIGSHLCEALLQRGDEVAVLDDLTAGRIENVAHLQEHKHFHLTIGSVLDGSCLGPMVRRAEVIFHLAAVVGVQKIIDAPVETIETNILGSHQVLSVAARHSKLCVLASTSEVYGKTNRCPFSEDDDVVYGPTSKARWSYASSKAIDEFLALAYYKTEGLPVIIARLFNTTGPRQTGRYGMVLPRFVDQALQGKPLTVFGTGEQTRCFADVSDVVRALLMLVAHPKARGQVFNVGNPEEVSILALAKLVKKLAASRSEIHLIPYDEAYQPGFEDMERRVPNIEKLSCLVGYKPKIKLQEIITRVIEYRRQEFATERLPFTAALGSEPLRAVVGE